MNPAPAILRGDAIPAEIMPSLTPGREAVQIGAWVADPGDDSLTRGGERVKLEPRMMKLLLRFAKEPGVVVSQEQLLESVWSGVVVSTASVYQSISQLRKVLGDVDDTPQYIETVARKGYRLIAPTGPVVEKAPERQPEAVATGNAESTPADTIAAPLPGSPAAEVRSSQLRLAPIAIVAVALIAFASLAYWKFRSPSSALQAATVGATTNSILSAIVVLPFVDMSPGGKEQAFCDGLTEEMSNWLAQIPTLRVVARTSAFEFQNKNEDVRTIGKKLGTSHVIEGSLRRAGNKMRITVQLIDTRNGYNLWSGSYDVEDSNVLEVQEQVARAVANNLELRLTATTADRFADRRSATAEAYPLYLIARSHAMRITRDDNDKAIDYYKQALASDPNFSLAQVGLVMSLINQRYFIGRGIDSIAEEVAPILEAVQHHAPNLPELYVARGALETELRQRDSALRDLEYALKLNPNLREAASELGFYYLTNGEPRQSLDYYTRALKIDPLNFSLHANRCDALAMLGQGVPAEEACERARALRPEAAWVFAVSSNMEFTRGRVVEAMKWSDEAVKRGSDVAEVQAERAVILFALGLAAKTTDVFTQSYRSNPQGTVATAELAGTGAFAAVARGGSAALAQFIKTYRLGEGNTPGVQFELAHAALTAGDAATARRFVDLALANPALVAEDLASPFQAMRYGKSYLLTAAAALRATGDTRAADARLAELSALLDRLERAGVQTFGIHQLRADVAAMQGDDAMALRELQRAAELGWRSAWLAENAPHYSSVRKQAAFTSLLAAVRADNAAAIKEIFPN
jgi:TolB-like protein/DNA-binding winged helix-turn-helix (wHTH) protein/Tfp pilus assembly protein PilF